jgi:hypothetical protein
MLSIISLTKVASLHCAPRRAGRRRGRQGAEPNGSVGCTRSEGSPNESIFPFRAVETATDQYRDGDPRAQIVAWQSVTTQCPHSRSENHPKK